MFTPDGEVESLAAMTDDELIAFASAFRKGVLGDRGPERMCMAVCLPLVSLLSCGGVKCELVEGNIDDWDHCWIKLLDGRDWVLDPTADQFSDSETQMPSIFLGPRPPWYDTNPDNARIFS